MFQWLAKLFKRQPKTPPTSGPAPEPALRSPEPQVAQPKAAEPVVADPVVPTPAFTEPEVAEPALAEPALTEPEVAEPQPVQPEPEPSTPTELPEDDPSPRAAGAEPPRKAMVAGALEGWQVPLIERKLGSDFEVFAVDTTYEARALLREHTFQKVLIFEDGPFLEVGPLREALGKDARNRAADVEVIARREAAATR